MSSLRIETNAFNDATGCGETVDVAGAADCFVASAGDLESMADLSAEDLGCKPGSPYLVELVDEDDHVLGSVEVVAH